MLVSTVLIASVSTKFIVVCRCHRLQASAPTFIHCPKLRLQGLHTCGHILDVLLLATLTLEQIVGGPAFCYVALEASCVHCRSLHRFLHQRLFSKVEWGELSTGTLNFLFIIRGIYIFTTIVALRLDERMVSEGRSAQDTSSNCSCTLLVHPLGIPDIAGYFLYMHIVLITIFLLYPLLYHLVDVHVHVFGAHVHSVALPFHY